MEHDELMLPTKIADTYYHLHQQHRSAWSHEVDMFFLRFNFGGITKLRD